MEGLTCSLPVIMFLSTIIIMILLPSSLRTPFATLQLPGLSFRNAGAVTDAACRSCGAAPGTFPVPTGTYVQKTPSFPARLSIALYFSLGETTLQRGVVQAKAAGQTFQIEPCE